MRDKDKTQEQLIQELTELRQRTAELERAETKRTRAEEALHEREENFRALAEHAADGIVIVTAKGSFIYGNTKAAEITGYSVDELVRLTMRDFFLPDEYKRINRRFKKRIAGEAVSSQYKTVIIKKDGSRVPLEASIALTQWHGEQVRIVFLRDIAERTRAEEALKKSGEQYRALVDNVDFGITLIDVDHNIIMTNSFVAGRFKKSKSELIGKKCFREFEKRDDVCPHCPGTQAMATGKAAEIETEGIRDDQSRFHVRIQTFPIFADDGTVTAFIEVAEDISGRKQLEEELQESEEKYRELINGMNDTAWVIDFNGNFIDVNDAAVEVLGYSREELLSMGPHDIDTTLDAETITGLIKGMPTDKIQVFETTHTTKDGKVIPVEINSSLVTYQRKRAILSIARDITERKRMDDLVRAQRDLALAVNTARDVDEGLRICLETALNVSEMDCGGIYVVDEATGGLDLIFHKGLSPDFIKSVSHYDADSPNTQLVMAGKPIYSEHLKLKVPLNAVQKHEGLRAIAVLPMRHKDRVIGYLNLSSHTLHEVPQFSRVALEAIAAQIGGSIARLRAEEALRKSEERYRSLVENIDLGISLIDTDYNIIATNAFVASKFKKPVSELIGKKCFREFEQRDTVCRQCPGVQAMATGQPAEVETEAGRGDDGLVHLRLQAFPVFGQGGKATGFIEVAENITKRKRMQNKLRESEERYRSLINNVDQGINLIDANHNIIMVNDAQCKRFNKSLSEMIGEKCFRLFRQRHTVCPHCVGTQAMTTGQTAEIETERIGSDQSPSQLRVQAFPVIGEDGTATAFIQFIEDITERKQMELELRKSEERFRKVVETMEVGLGATDENGVYTYVNEFLAKMLGYSLDELIGRSALDFIYDEESREAQEEIFAKRRKGMRDPAPYEVARRRKDGQKIYAILSPTPSFDADGRFTGSFAIHTDITERKRMEQELRESEERYRLLFENESDAVLVCDAETLQLEDANKAALDLYGYSKEAWRRLRVPDISAEAEKSIESIEKVKAGDPDGMKIQLRHHRKKDGTVFPAEITNGVLVSGGRKKIIGMVRDITERKQAEEALKKSEEKYRLLSENIPVAVYSALPDEYSTNLFLSGQFLELTGYPMEQFLKDPELWDSILHPDDRDYVWEKMEEHRRTKELLEVEYRILTKNNTIKWVRDRARPVLGENGEIMRIDGFMEDITERKQAEQALRESEEKYRSLVESSEDSIYVVDSNCNYIFLNDKHLSRLGKHSKQVIGESYGTFHSPEETKDFAQRVKNVFKTGESQSYEYRSQRDNRYFIRTLSPVQSSDGGKTSVITVISKDITDLKHAEETLREREAFNFALFQYNPIETIVVDRDGKITGFNLAKQQSGTRLPTIGDLMYKDYAGKHEIDMRAELMQCIRSGKIKEFPERKYGDKYLSITISPFAQGALIISEDITERKRTLEALRESEQFSSNLLNDSPHPIIVINPDTSIRYVNPAMADQTGFFAEELIGRKAPYPWWPKGTVRRATRSVKKAMREGNQRLERNFQKKNGERFWVEITAIPAMHDGEVQYLLANWSVITERKQAEELLQKERDTFFSILQRAPYGVMLLDKDGNHSFVNPEFTNITGYSLEDIPTGEDWLLRAYPDPQYRNMVRKMWWKDFKQQVADEKFQEKFKRVFSRAFNVVCKDGTTKEIEFSRADLGDGGTLAMLADITERKRMHELLQTAAAEWRTTFDAISDAVCLLSTQGKIIRCNNAMLKLIGKPFSEITNHHCWEVMHGVSEAPSGCPITRVAETHQRQSEVFAKNSRWFNVSVDPLLDENGALVGGVHIMSDITDRKIIEDELQGSREQLRNLTAYLESVREQERTNIAREIHDELPQALTALKMDLSWLDHRLPTDPKSLIEKTQSMHDLIDTTIQTVKRISSELRPGILDDLGLVAAIEWQTEEFQNRTGIICHVTVDPQDITVDQDRSTTIFRIFQETLTNVARHAHATRVTVSLKEKGGTLLLRVRDNGTGIAEEKISDPQSFGLIGMQERVFVWGGKVSFKGIPGKGTTVTVNVRIRGDNKPETTLEKNKDS